MTPRLGGAATAVPLVGLRRGTRFLVLGLIAIAAIAAWHWKTVLDPIAIVDVDYWNCKMHNSVHSKATVKCPICGMDLVQVILGK